MAFSVELGVATVVMEASNQGYDVMLAVAFVLLNRIKDGRWGTNLASVCLAPEQFSCWNTKDRNRKRLAEMRNDDPSLLLAQKALLDASNGVPDPSHGATHYYSIDIPAPSWAASGRFLVQHNELRFYDEVA